MNDNRRETWHYAIRAAVLLGFALLIAYLTKTGALGLYIAPKMRLFVKLSAIALYAIAMYQAWLALGSRKSKAQASCGCDHAPKGSWWKHAAVYGLFAVPLIFGFALPDTVMGSTMADQKGMNFSAASQIKSDVAEVRETALPSVADEGKVSDLTPAETNDTAEPNDPAVSVPEAAPASDDPFAPSDIFEAGYAKFAKKLSMMDVIEVDPKIYMETLTTIDLFLDPLLGSKIEITGFVYRTDKMSESQFAVGRFAMNCCSADAAPFGVFAEYAEANRYADDEWVKVAGTIGKTSFNGFDIMKIDVERIETVNQPLDPYVYPNYEFDFDA